MHHRVDGLEKKTEGRRHHSARFVGKGLFDDVEPGGNGIGVLPDFSKFPPRFSKLPLQGFPRLDEFVPGFVQFRPHGGQLRFQRLGMCPVVVGVPVQVRQGGGIFPENGGDGGPARLRIRNPKPGDGSEIIRRIGRLAEIVFPRDGMQMDRLRVLGETPDVIVVDEDAESLVVWTHFVGQAFRVEDLFVVDPVEKTDVVERNVLLVFDIAPDFLPVGIEQNRPRVRINEFRPRALCAIDEFRQMVGMDRIVVVHVGHVFGTDQAKPEIEGRGLAVVRAIVVFDPGIAESRNDGGNVFSPVIHDKQPPIRECLVGNRSNRRGQESPPVVCGEDNGNNGIGTSHKFA